MSTAAARSPAPAATPVDPALATHVSVTGLMIQFFSKNPDLFPGRFNRVHEVKWTNTNSPSAEIIPATEDVLVNPLLADLAKAGFVLADGFSYQRHPDEDTQFGRKLSVMRFQFYPGRTFKFESEGKKRWAEGNLSSCFSLLTVSAYWKVVGYNNTLNSGGNAIGIKCSNRLPTTKPDGTPLTRKPRDARGNPCGDEQPFVPLAKGQLRVMSGRLLLA